MLADFLPDDIFIAPRLMEEVDEYSPFPSAEKEALSGALLAVAGPLPILVHEAAATPALFEAFDLAGLAHPRRVETYSSRAQYLDALNTNKSAGNRAWFTFPVPDWMGENGSTLTPCSVVAALNDRRAAERLVPLHALPRRRILEGNTAVRSGLAALKPGQVAKLLGAPASSGGAHVQIVHNRRHVSRAQKKLQNAEAIVIEDLLPSRRSICAQVVVAANGSVRWVGASDQLLTRSGLYLGNDMSGDVPDGVRDLALEIGNRAAQESFAGFAGFDILDTDKGPKAVDLNFRPNGSTPLLLLYDTFAKKTGLSRARLTFARRQGSLDAALKSLIPAISDGWVVPTCGFDPSAAGFPEAPSSLRLIVLSGSDKQLAQNMKALTALGFQCPAYRRSSLQKLWDKAIGKR